MEGNFLHKKRYFSKKGLSAIVTTLILVVLSMAAVVIVWVAIKGTVEEQMGNTQSCFGNYDKIKFNSQYTCFNRTSVSNYNLRFSLIIEDIDIDKAIVSVSSGSAVKSYTLTSTAQTIDGLKMYPSGSDQIILPEKNSGLSYNAEGFTDKIDSISVTPYIGDAICDSSQTISEIGDCMLLS